MGSLRKIEPGNVRAWCSRHQQMEEWTIQEAREHWKDALMIPAGTPSMSFDDLGKIVTPAEEYFGPDDGAVEDAGGESKGSS